MGEKRLQTVFSIGRRLHGEQYVFDSNLTDKYL